MERSFTLRLGGSLLSTLFRLGLGFAFGPRGGSSPAFPLFGLGKDVIKVLDSRHVSLLLLQIHILQDIWMIPDLTANRVCLG